MVMPRSRSWSLLSMARSTVASLARKAPDWASSWSTSVVLPWSTWAMMAMLRRFMRGLGTRGHVGRTTEAAKATGRINLLQCSKSGVVAYCTTP
jgi:hypothetical protein